MLSLPKGSGQVVDLVSAGEANETFRDDDGDEIHGGDEYHSFEVPRLSSTRASVFEAKV